MSVLIEAGPQVREYVASVKGEKIGCITDQWDQQVVNTKQARYYTDG